MRQHSAHNLIETRISTVPPDAPPEVAALSTRFSELMGRHEEARAERKAAKAAVTEARREDVAAAAARIAADEPEPKDAGKHERDALARVTAAERHEEAVLAVLDQAGDELAEAILAAREEWQADVREQLGADLETYRETLAATHAALVRIQRGLGLLESLARFRVARHPDGSMTAVDVRFNAGGRLKVNTKPVSPNDRGDALDLIESLGTLEVTKALKPKATEVAA